MVPVAHAGGANPFVGLRAFGVADADTFFGREAPVKKVLARLRDTRFLAIVGASGCGKSSLVLAGLIPALQRGALARAGDSWRIATMRPGAAPLEALASVLARTQVLGEQAADPDLQRAEMLRGLRRGELGLVDLVANAGLRKGESVLVVVDEFEELFRYAPDADRAEHASDAAAFVNLLLTAASWTDLPIYVAVTMRSDCIGDCAQFPGLAEAVNDGVFLVPRLTREELQRSIEEPVLSAGERVAPRLVARLLDDVGDDSDQLPILEHVLMRTWDAWDKDHAAGEPLDLRHYELIGQMRGALAKHANDIYDGFDPRLKNVAERLFRCLTARDGANRDVRRPTSFGAACAITAAQPGEIERLVRVYAAPAVSFLTVSGPLSNPKTVLDISHESLVRLWDRLRAWVGDEAESAKTYRRLVDDASMKRAYWIDPQLAIGEAWLAKNRASINPAWAARYDESAASGAARDRFDTALAFLNASAAAPRRSVGAIIALVGVFFVIAAALAIFGFVKYGATVAERHRVEELNKTTVALQSAKAMQARRLDAAIAKSNQSKQLADSEIERAKRTTEGANKRVFDAAQLAKANDEKRRRADEQVAAELARAQALAADNARIARVIQNDHHVARPSRTVAATAAPVRRAAAVAATPVARVRDGANAAPCIRAVDWQRVAADAVTSRASYDASTAGLAENALCDNGQARIVNEGYLRSTLAAAEHELSLGDWRAELRRANELLAQCETLPALRATKAAADCLLQRRFNERAAAEFAPP